MAVDLKEQYDKILRYCFYKVHNRETAEDITQETFLRFLENPQYHGLNKDLQYLYTIAGNLCVSHYRKKTSEELTDTIPDSKDFEEDVLNNTALKSAMQKLSDEDREIILLRYANEVPVGVLSELYGVSRFKMGRRIKKIVIMLKKDFGVVYDGEEAEA
ncbi:MAG: sigma-70 family RNA polymerase sigma factor [Ruminococcus sp.]|nr:sigma-70 family RNA polymerase sigma factor [Ruminococcus sp.]